MSRGVWSVIAALTCAGCAPGAAPDPAEEVARIEAVAHGLMAADNVRDAARVAELYAPDAVMLPLGEEPVQGIASIRPRYEAFFATHQPDLRFEIEETVVAGNLAYVRGRTRGSIRNLETGEEQMISDVFLMIQQRAPDGRWHISRLMWHADDGSGP